MAKKPAQIFSAVKQKRLSKATKSQFWVNNLGGPQWVIPITLGIFFITQFLVAFLVAVGVAVTKGPGQVDDIFENAPVEFILVLAIEAATVAAVLWVLKLRKAKAADIGLGRRPVWKDIGWALGGFVASYTLLIIVLALVSQFLPSINLDQKQEVGFDQLNSGLDRLLAFMSLVVLAPIGEEVLVRGYLYSGLRSRLRFLPSMIITSLLFSVAHLELGYGAPPLWVAAISTFILSLSLVYVREKSGALYASILVHMLNNLVAYLVIF